MRWNNTLTAALKIDYPIVQAPMLGVSTPQMAAEVSNHGGLGSLAVGGLSPDATVQLIRKISSLTNRPFAVNLFAHEIPAFEDDNLEPMRQLLLQLARERGYNLQASDLSNFPLYTYHDQLDILLQEAVSIVSFTFGCLDKDSALLLKEKGCLLIGTATCVEEALFLQQQQIDMIAVQGIEAGGHRGTFLSNDVLPQIGLFSLLPQIINAVQVPCIAAGGIHNAQTMKAAFDLGAAAVQVGSAFIDTEESDAIPSYKQRLQKAKDTDTTLTKAFSGRWARGFRNELMEAIVQSGIEIPPYPLQNALISKLRKLAQQRDDSEFTTLWAGQSARTSETSKTASVFMNLVKDYEAMYL